MASIGYLLLCEDVMYDKEQEFHFVKNPLEVILLDRVPSKYDFFVLASLFNVDTKTEYIIEVEIFDSESQKVSSMDTPIIFASNPPKGKSDIGVITLKIHHQNFEFPKEGVYKLVLKIEEKETGQSSIKQIQFPVFLKQKDQIEGDEDDEQNR